MPLRRCGSAPRQQGHSGAANLLSPPGSTTAPNRQRSAGVSARRRASHRPKGCPVVHLFTTGSPPGRAAAAAVAIGLPIVIAVTVPHDVRTNIPAGLMLL